MTSSKNDYKSQQIDVFTELDPLGSGLIKPYVDKKDFFSNLKNPPKKVLKDLAVISTAGDTFPTNFNITTEPIQPVKVENSSSTNNEDNSEKSGFANFEKFKKKDEPKCATGNLDKDFPVSTVHHQPLSVSLPPEESSSHKCSSGHYTSTSSIKEKKFSSVSDSDKDSRYSSPRHFSRRTDFSANLQSFRRQLSTEKSLPMDFASLSDSYPSTSIRSTSRNNYGSPERSSQRAFSSSSAESENVPEPPPRGSGSIVINPPPLPPKKQCSRDSIKPPPRPPHNEGQFHYDFLEREDSPSPTRRDRRKSNTKETRSQFDDNFSPPLPQLPKRLESGEFSNSSFEDSFSNIIPSSLSSLFQNSISSDKTSSSTKKNKPKLDITLSQLTSSNLSELATSLDMSVAQLTSLTLQQLTECLSNLSRRDSVFEDKSEPSTPQQKPPNSNIMKNSSISSTTTTFTTISDSKIVTMKETNFSPDKKMCENDSYDKYAVFRELVNLESNSGEFAVSINSQQTEEKENLDKCGDKEFQPEIAIDGDDNEDEEENDDDENEFQKFEEEVDDDDNEEDEETEDADKLRIKRRLFEKCESEDRDEPFVSLTNLTVKLPSVSEDLKAESYESDSLMSKLVEDKSEEDAKSQGSAMSIKIDADKSDTSLEQEIDKKLRINDNKYDVEIKCEIKTSTSASSDRYAALREIIDESKIDTEQVSFPISPNKSSTEKAINDVDLMNLFSDNFYPPSSKASDSRKLVSKKEDDTKTAVMDIFEEIKMLNNSTSPVMKESNTKILAKFDDIFSPFSEPKTEMKAEENKDDENWAKFDSNVFSSDKSSGDGPTSISGTSPWSPDGREFSRDSLRTKPRYSGDSDNECKDDEESEESNGRMRGDKSWGSSSGRKSREYYEETLNPMERSRSFREKNMSRSFRGTMYLKGHKRDPSNRHEEGRWEEDDRRYMHRKLPHKDDDDYQQHMMHWKCRNKQRSWKNGSSGSGSGGGGSSGSGEREGFWPHDSPSSHSFYEDEQRMKRRMVPWTDEDMPRPETGRRIDRFSSQESMGYEDDERWSRRWDDYDRRRWEDDGSFWNRRGMIMDSDYANHMYRKHEPHYMRDRAGPLPPPPPHEREYRVPGNWEDEEEDYSPDRPDDSPRYIARNKRHWPKRPNSANEDRSVEMNCYLNVVRPKYNMSRSECSDNDSDPYHRSRRSRSRDRGYWGSDQEFDNWGETPLPPSHWSEVPPATLPHADVKGESLHRRRMNRHRPRLPIKLGQQSSPFEDDFTQNTERRGETPIESPVAEPQRSPRIVDLDIKQQHQTSPSPRSFKDSKRDSKPHKSYFEDELTPTTSVASDVSDRQHRIGFSPGSESKATPEEPAIDVPKIIQEDNFTVEQANRGKKVFNGNESKFDEDAFAFQSELEDQVPEQTTNITQKNNARQMKYGGKNQYIKKSDSVNIFSRENDPFDDDFFN